MPSRAGMTVGGALRGWPAPLIWLTALSVAAVVAVNAFGVWGIAVARRGVMEDAERMFRLETTGRARTIESALAATRGDLAFLAGSPAFFDLEAALASRDPTEARWHRLGAEGSLLLFLRGHTEVAHLALRSPSGRALVEVGRRGGIPVLWVAGRTSGGDDAASGGIGTSRRRVTGSFVFGAPAPRGGSVTLDAEIDPAALLSHGGQTEHAPASCLLADASGTTLAADPVPKGGEAPALSDPEAPDSARRAEVPIRTEGWSAAAPWRIACTRIGSPAAALFDPIARRYRMTLALNLGVMALALLLGAFVIQQARRRQRMEERAIEETRIRELERRLFHAERLSTIGRFAAGIAHEINNPLEGMANYLGLAREDLSIGSIDSARRRLDGVKQGLDRAAAIVRQVLAHADPATAPKSAMDLGPVLRESLEFVRSRKEFAAVTFALDGPESPLPVRGSPAMLGQVFLNLILNACEAQPRGGEVKISATRSDGSVVVEFADRGPGVPHDDASRIFEPFYSTKDSTGLGLSICWSIVRDHGGDLSVQERPGGGAIFRMKLPSAEEITSG